MKKLKRWEDIHTDGINRLSARAHFVSLSFAYSCKNG